MEIVNFHRKYFTPGIVEAKEDSQKFLSLFQNRSKDLKTLYGSFCINFKKATHLIKQNEDYVKKVEKAAGAGNAKPSLQDLLLR